MLYTFSTHSSRLLRQMHCPISPRPQDGIFSIAIQILSVSRLSALFANQRMQGKQGAMRSLKAGLRTRSCACPTHAEGVPLLVSPEFGSLRINKYPTRRAGNSESVQHLLGQYRTPLLISISPRCPLREIYSCAPGVVLAEIPYLGLVTTLISWQRAATINWLLFKTKLHDFGARTAPRRCGVLFLRSPGLLVRRRRPPSRRQLSSRNSFKVRG